MPSPSPAPRQNRDPLSRALALVVAAVVAIIALEWFGATWSLVLALATAVAGAVLTGTAIRRITKDEDGNAALRSPRHAAVLFGFAVVVTLLVVTTSLRQDRAGAQTGATAAGATQTVRDFLAQAVLDGNDYVACQYLTPAEQHRVTRLSPDSGDCRAALLQAPATMSGVTSLRGLHRLRLRTVVDGDRASTTVTGPDTPTLRFTLQRAAPGDFAPFEAPGAAWRIGSGIEALLGAPAAVATSSHV